ncbi:MAG: hypothetical protein PHF29_08890 [Candidatus Riflebacteria bacterium]|nr:hypothetical protein [Candidatus Riflebacteria bacterium]
MAGETTSFFANAILSGLNQGLQDRRALKEERRLMALKQQEEERLRQAALQDIEIRNSMQDKRYENILRPRALKELKENQAIKQQQLDAEREKQIGIGAMLSQEAKLPDYAYEVIAKAYGLPSLRDNTNSELKGSKALRSGNNSASDLALYKALRETISEGKGSVDPVSGEVVGSSLDPKTLNLLQKRAEQMQKELFGLNPSEEDLMQEQDALDFVLRSKLPALDDLQLSYKNDNLKPPVSSKALKNLRKPFLGSYGANYGQQVR